MVLIRWGVGGRLYQQLGKMPSPGDEVEVDGPTIRIIPTMGRRIKQVKMAKRQPPSRTRICI